MSAIGVQLGHLRVARGLTQQQLAERTGLRRDTISALERGKSQAIEFTTLARLCDALGVGPGDLLTLAPTAHVAPILGGDDEDEILAERMAQDEQDIAAFIADPSLAAQYLTLEEVAADEANNHAACE
jgi:putative transcriptional regulator